MFSLRKFSFSFLFTVPLLLTACGSGGADVNDDATMEMVFSENSTLAIVVDYSDEDQVEQLKSIGDRFPENDLWDEMKQEFEYEMGDDLDQFNKYWDIVSVASFRFGMGVALSEDLESFEEIEDVDSDNVEIVLTGEFEDGDAIEEMMEEMMADAYTESELVVEDNGGVKTWTVETDNFFAVRYGDIFFLTNTLENKGNILDRLNNAERVFDNSDVEILSEPKLGYVFLDLDRIIEILEDSHSSELEELKSLYSLDADLMGLLGDVYVTFSADEGGIKLVSATELSGGEEELAEFIPGVMDEPSLVNKVNAEGLFFYIEDQDLGFYFEAAANSFGTLAGAPTLSGTVEDIVDGTFFAEALGYLADVSGLSTDEVEELLEAPFAISMSKTNDYFPTLAFYLNLSESTIDLGKRFSSGLDQFAAELIEEFNADIPADLEGADALKREALVVEGGALYRVYVDWTVFSEETLAGWGVIPGLDITDLKLELYYGVTGNGVLVLAFYPDFGSEFGENVLAEDPLYKEAVESVGDSYGYNVGYFSTAPLIELINGYVGLARLGGFVADSEMDEYNLYVNKLFAAFKYAISSKAYSDGMLKSSVYLRIEGAE
jgi:hypothetical protein